MAQAAGKQRINFLFLIIALVFSGCANQLPPGGGEIDRIPPKIIDLYPPNETTNFDDDYFELEFSEYVDKRSLQDAIFISPAIEGSLDLDWSGKSVKVKFPSKLKSNTTYVVTIGTDVVDFNNKNRMAESFNFTFSTGSQIDKRIISGKVYNEKPAGILIFAYKLNTDTADPFQHKPGYISQTGNDGSFKLLGLAEGTYRIFAVKDEFRDLLFQPDQDLIGVPFKDIYLAENDSLFSPLNFFLMKVDTVKPRFVSASMTDHFHILINFTEEVDTSIMKANNFFIFDSTANKKILPLYTFKGNTKPAEMVLVDSVQFPSNHEVYIFADSIKDLNKNLFVNDRTPINLSDKPDTAKLVIYRTEPLGGSRDIDFIKPVFSFYFNDAFSLAGLKENVIFQDTVGRRIPFSIKILDDASFSVVSSNRLEPDKEYLIKINLSKFKDAAGNSSDTTVAFKYKTISGLDFTGITGLLTNVNLNDNPVVVLTRIDNKKYNYTKKLSAGNKFGLDRILPGKYVLWAYLDQDSSGNYSYGYPFPYSKSEQFSFYPDTLNLRARWVQTDIKFQFK